MDELSSRQSTLDSIWACLCLSWLISTQLTRSGAFPHCNHPQISSQQRPGTGCPRVPLFDRASALTAGVISIINPTQNNPGKQKG